MKNATCGRMKRQIKDKIGIKRPYKDKRPYESSQRTSKPQESDKPISPCSWVPREASGLCNPLFFLFPSFPVK